MGKRVLGGRSQFVEVKVMNTSDGEGCQGKEASGEVDVLNINLGSYSFKTMENIYKNI